MQYVWKVQHWIDPRHLADRLNNNKDGFDWTVDQITQAVDDRGFQMWTIVSYREPTEGEVVDGCFVGAGQQVKPASRKVASS